MKTTILISPEALAWRKKIGADLWDEVWDGVLHMNPAPSVEHSRFLRDLLAALDSYAQRRGLGRFYPQINVAPAGMIDWTSDFRIPDLLVVFPDETSQLHENHFEGAPRLIVEIRSPDDETYEKLGFYAKIGVHELIVIDRDTKKVEVFALAGTQMTLRPAGKGGFYRCEELHLDLGHDAGKVLLREVGASTPFAIL